MMAAAGPLPVMSAPVPQPRQKRREPFDAALLCNKLEAHLREQDAARLRREKRDAVRNGHYVPRVAAKAFAATSTPMQDDIDTTRAGRRASERPRTTDEGSTTNGRSRSSQMPQYTLNFRWPSYQRSSSKGDAERTVMVLPEVMSTSDEVAAVCETSATQNVMQVRHEGKTKNQKPLRPEQQRENYSERRSSPYPGERRQSNALEKQESREEEAKHDSMNPTSSQGVPLFASHEASPTRRRLQSPQVNPRQSSRAAVTSPPDRGRGQYRPGDAAKRRSIEGQRPAASEQYHGAEGRTSRFLENEAFLDDSIPEEDTLRPQRPKLAPHDRPNWAQQSQTGDDMHLSLRFFTRSSKKKTDDQWEVPRPHSVMGVGMGNVGAASKDHGRTSRKASLPLPEEGHLIADAVKKIKKEEKMERRKSVFGLTGLFKRS